LYPLDLALTSSSSVVTFLFATTAEKAAVGRARRGAKERDSEWASNRESRSEEEEEKEEEGGEEEG
jgi:hypothetical protein